MAAMNWLQWYFELSNTIATFGANVLVQTTLVIGGGLSAAWLCRRRGAAVQSAILRVTLVAALVCPVTSWVLSTVGVTGFRVVLPQGSMLVAMAEPQSGPDSADGREFVLNDPSIASAPKEIDDSPWRRSGLVPSYERSASGGLLPPLSDSQVRADAPAEVIPERESPEEAATTTAATTTIRRPSALAVVYGGLAAAWLVAANLLIARLVIANLLMWRVRPTARPASADLANECGAIARVLNVAAPPVLVGSQITSPCLIGWWRPVILLPSELTTISGDALAHELAHLLRRDCLWNLISRLSVATFPVQPLLWVLARRLEDAADEVCDDFVVTQSQDRASYARELVDIAERFQPDWSAATVGVGIAALKSSLAKRVLRILDTSRALSTRTGLVALLVILASGLGGVLTAGFIGAPRNQIAFVSELDEQAVGVQPTDLGDGHAKADTISERTEASSSGEQLEVPGRVLQPDGTPASGAKVYVVASYWGQRASEPTLETTSDAQGEFTLRYPETKFAGALAARIIAIRDGFGPDWFELSEFKSSRNATLRLAEDDVPINGRVLDLEGRPVVGAKVSLVAIRMLNTPDVASFFDAVKSNNLYTAFGKTWAGSLPGSKSVETDQLGRFRLTGVGRGRVVDLLVEGRTIEHRRLEVLTHVTEPVVVAERISRWEPRKFYGATFEYLALPSRSIVGAVRDKETGKPIPGVQITAGSMSSAFSDEQGRFELVGTKKLSDTASWRFRRPVNRTWSAAARCRTPRGWDR